MIKRYVRAYNNFDIDRMMADMDDDVKFENIADGVVTLSLEGKDALKVQAGNAKNLFKKRKQTITHYSFGKDYVEIRVNYSAIVAIDLPEGIKAGDSLELKGRSIFMFKDNKIIELKDIAE